MAGEQSKPVIPRLRSQIDEVTAMQKIKLIMAHLAKEDQETVAAWVQKRYGETK